MFLIRGEKVMLAQHLAELYGVPVRALNQAVKRNIKRFPADFMFQLTREEFERLKSQIVISSRKIEALEKKYDEQFAEVFAAIKELIAARATTTQNRLTEYDFSRGVRGKYARRYARGSDVVVPSVPTTT